MTGRLLENFCAALRILLACLVGILAIPVTMQVLARYTGIIPVYLWTEELATFIFVWVVMIGSMVAVWDGTHFDVQVIPDAKHPVLKLIQTLFVMVAVMCFGLIFAWYGIEYAEFGNIQKSTMMRANMIITFISVPIAGAVWTLFCGYRIYETIAQFRAAQQEPTS